MTPVPVDTSVCPDCTTPTRTLVVHQDALVRHGGYGATRRTETRYCPACGWYLHALTAEQRPPAD